MNFEIVKVSSGPYGSITSGIEQNRRRTRGALQDDTLSRDSDGFKRPRARIDSLRSNDSTNHANNSTSDDEQPLSSVAKRNQKRLKSDSPDIPLNKTKRNQTSCNDKGKGNKKQVSAKASFTCGACKETVQKHNWRSHLFQHAGLAWRVGHDLEFDLNDENVCLNVMRRYRISNNLKFLKCPKCLVEERRSAEGIISHMRLCGMSADEIETAKVSCPHCDKKLIKDSLYSHLRLACTVLKEQQRLQEQLNEKATDEVAQESDPEQLEYSERGRIKRKSVKLAEKKLKKVLQSSSFIPEDVSCNFCYSHQNTL